MKQLNKLIDSGRNSSIVRSMVKIEFKRFVSLALVFTLLFTFVFPLVKAEGEAAKFRTKDEVVYGKIDPYGEINSGYVVNVFEVTRAGEIVDYGQYSAVKNLTNLSDVKNGTGEVKFDVEEGKFYYQGDLATVEFPWDFTVTYYLEGRQVEIDELLGASGHVEITIETEENSAVDSVFFEHYTLQVSLPFDVENFSNIKAEAATVANAGKMEQVTFTVLPEEEEKLTVTADVTDFEFGGIDIVAIPFAMTLDELETDDMVDDFDKLSDAIAELHDGIGKLNDGVRELRDGTGDLQEGSAKFQQGLVDLNGASGPLVNGSAQIKKALETMKDELSFVEDIDLSQVDELTKGLEAMEKGIRDIADGLDELADGYASLKQVVNQIPDLNDESALNEKDLQAIQQAIGKEKFEYLMINYNSARKIKEMFSHPEYQALDYILKELKDELYTIATGLQHMNNELEKSLNKFAELEKLPELIDGINEFNTEYNLFHQGLVDYTNGVGELTTAYGELHGGISELSTGTDDLSSGTAKLYDGTDELSNETATLPEDVQEKIDEFIESYDHSDFEAKSFVSEKNDNIGVVQFILKTEGITHPEIEEKEEQVEEKKGFWEMVKRLFRKD